MIYLIFTSLVKLKTDSRKKINLLIPDRFDVLKKFSRMKDHQQFLKKFIKGQLKNSKIEIYEKNF